MNGIIVIDKPPEWTSHDVCAKLRGMLKQRRIGHGGTLDPMATGVLPVFLGRAARAIELLPSDKLYRAVMTLGVVTDTQDTTGNVLSTCGDIPSAEEIKKAVDGFAGECEQIPPMVSAIRVNGQRLYKLARQGIEIERAPRAVRFDKIEIGEINGREVGLTVECTGGTYIRTLCHDIGAKLGCGAAMSSLRRLRSGPFGIESAVKLEDAAHAAPLQVDALFPGLPDFVADSEQEKRIRNGADFKVRLPEGRYKVYGGDGEFLMLGNVSGMKMTAIKNFFEV